MTLGKQLAVELFMMVLIGLLLGLLGPFGTFPMPLGQRLIYWVTFIIVGYAIFRPITAAADWITQVSAIPGWMATIMATAVAAFPQALFIAFAFGGFGWRENALLGANFAILYAQVAGIGMAIFLLMQLIFGNAHTNSASDPSASQEPGLIATTPGAPTGTPMGAAPMPASPLSPPLPQETQPRLRRRLPPAFPAQIIALGVEDHYVRVYSERQSSMLLMRLADAIAEMDVTPGLQVHRSWWVAEGAVRKVERKGRTIMLTLSNGIAVPVSRPNVAKVKQAGWIL
jgi:hypothetical protein